DGVAQAGHEREVALGRIRAPHRLENPRRARLCRNVRVLTDGRAFAHGGDDGLAKVLRGWAGEADPIDPVDRIARAQEPAELRADAGSEVGPRRFDVLAGQRALAAAVAGEPLDLGEDVSRAPALFAPADSRDDAVRAVRVAAHRNLHPRLDGPLAT